MVIIEKKKVFYLPWIKIFTFDNMDLPIEKYNRMFLRK